jgi:hypothetical protein
MNMKQKRTTLKVEFKQFQRLPDWPIIIRSAATDRSREDTSVPKTALAALLIQENRFGIRTLAE